MIHKVEYIINRSDIHYSGKFQLNIVEIKLPGYIENVTSVHYGDDFVPFNFNKGLLSLTVDHFFKNKEQITVVVKYESKSMDRDIKICNLGI